MVKSQTFRPRGVQRHQETNQDTMYRDTRSVFTKAIQQMHSPMVMASVLGGMAAAAYMMPAVADLLGGVSLLGTWWALTRPEDLPLKVPVHAKTLDPKETIAGKPQMAGGIFYLGVDRFSRKELWLTNSDCRQHMLVLGTTGAGKTENLMGFLANALSWSSGFLFVDGKADVSVFGKIYALARQFGREDDLLLINFMTGNADVSISGGELITNTLNPFATGSSGNLTQMIVSLMADTGGDGAMWKGRAQSLMSAIIWALTWMRDRQMIDLNVGTIREFLNLGSVIDLGDPKKYPDMPQEIRTSVRSYLKSLAGFQEEKGHKQQGTALDQHGYLQMQFTQILGSLADTYGHIFFTEAGEVDMHDVVLNRRLLVVMLPALEVSGDELANLGKIVVANLKGMMGKSLGSKIQGPWTDIVDKRMTNSPSPFVVVLDEVGYYTVDGMALMTAQARSLGFMMVLASQDIPAMKRNNEKEAASIIANTSLKAFGRIEEMTETAKLALDSAGKAHRANVSGFSGATGEMGTAYRDNMEARFDESDRVSSRDLRSLKEGELILTHYDNVIYAEAFYANPEGSLKKRNLVLSANHFIKVPKPSRADIDQAERIPEVLAKLLDRDFAQSMVAETEAAKKRLKAQGPTDEIGMAVVGFYNYLAGKPESPTEAACAAIANAIRSSNGLAEVLGGQIRKSSQRPASPSPEDYLIDNEFSPPSALPEGRDLLADHDTQGFDTSYGDPGLDDHIDEIMPPQAPPRVRRMANVRNVEHSVHVDGNKVDDPARAMSGNDAVARTLADLDYDAETTTTEEIDDRLNQDLGALSDIQFQNVSAQSDIDELAVRSQDVREPASTSVESVEDRFISDFLDSLIEQGIKDDDK